MFLVLKQHNPVWKLIHTGIMLKKITVGWKASLWQRVRNKNEEKDAKIAFLKICLSHVLK